MKIPKAIEIMQDLLGEGPHFPPDDRRDAVKLGIEALKRVKRDKLKYYYPADFNLPGETEE